MIDSFARSASLNRHLGDPADGGSVMSIQAALDGDDRSEFPQDQVDALTDWGLHRAYVPASLGGDFLDALSLMLLLRHVARRDLTTAVAHGKTFFGGLCSWLAGGDVAEQMAAIVLSGAPVSWGLTEQDRGSDLTRTAARWRTDSTRLSGGKWPINNATRGRAMCALVRTRESPGPRSLSLVLIDKEELNPRLITYRPKVRTHGIRGADISGVDWHDVAVPLDRRIGDLGYGLDLVLRALQVTRTTCVALSLGAADQAIEMVLNFARERIVHGRALIELPNARAEIGALIADAFVAEAAATVGGRCATARPEELGLVSACVKYVVPATVDVLFQGAIQILGARSQLTGIAGAGQFDKARRDHRVVGIFDGNSVVNLRAVINEFPALTKGLAQFDGNTAPLRLLDPGSGSQGMDLSRLRLLTRTGSLVAAAASHLAATSQAGSDEPRRALRGFERASRMVSEEVRKAPQAKDPDAGLFDLARRVTETFAGAACLVVALGGHRRSRVGSGKLWLEAALSRVCQRLGLPVDSAAETYAQLTDNVLADQAIGSPVSLFEGWS
jgi:alkylation response protein AidB-like acyl-CoA dehydrogenase